MARNIPPRRPAPRPRRLAAGVHQHRVVTVMGGASAVWDASVWNPGSDPQSVWSAGVWQGMTYEAVAGPTTPTLVFESLWDTATGTGDAAVLNTSAATPWEIRIGGAGSGLSVVNAASEGLTGCPTTNALRTDLVYVGGGVQNMDTDQVSNLPGSGAWPVPAVGDSLYFCLYKWLVYPDVADPGALGNNNHPNEQAAGGSNDWSWSYNTASAGEQPSFNLWDSGVATRYQLNDGAAAYIPRGAWWRYEWRLHRTGTTTVEFEVRIYEGDSTTPTYTDADLLNGATPLTGVSKTITDVNEWDGWQLGTNGPHVVGATQGAAPAWYWAAARVSAEDWIGPYV